jgi:hypothetical protein
MSAMHHAKNSGINPSLITSGCSRNIRISSFDIRIYSYKLEVKNNTFLIPFVSNMAENLQCGCFHFLRTW